MPSGRQAIIWTNDCQVFKCIAQFRCVKDWTGAEQAIFNYSSKLWRNLSLQFLGNEWFGFNGLKLLKKYPVNWHIYSYIVWQTYSKMKIPALRNNTVFMNDVAITPIGGMRQILSTSQTLSKRSWSALILPCAQPKHVMVSTIDTRKSNISQS